MPDISLIPQKQKKRSLPRFSTFRGPKIRLSIAGKTGAGLLIFSVLVSVGMFMWNNSLESRQAQLQEDFKNLILSRDISLDKDLEDLSILVQSLDGLLSDHRNWSELFSVLEKRVLLGVTLESFNSSYQDASFSVGGTASSYNTLAQQIKSLEEESSITNIDLSKISLNKEGGINFSIQANFKKILLKKPSSL